MGFERRQGHGVDRERRTVAGARFVRDAVRERQGGGIMTGKGFAWGIIVVATMMVALLGLWGVSAGGKEHRDQVGIPPETVADYVHDVIEADRTFYTIHVVDRMQVRGIVVASENWEERGTLPLPAQFLMEAARLVGEKGNGVRYRLISLWPIKTCYRHVDTQPKARPRLSNHSTLSGASRVHRMCSSKFFTAASVTLTFIRRGTSGEVRFSPWSPDTKLSDA